MKCRSRVLCVSAAVAAVVLCGANARALDLAWDANGSVAPSGASGAGIWNTSNLNWVDGTSGTPTNVSWTNGSSAYLGSATNPQDVDNALPTFVELAEEITVQNLTLDAAADGTVYGLSDFQFGSLVLAGNVTKASARNQAQINFTFGMPLTLTAGDHVFTSRDTPGDVAEVVVNARVAGAGGLTIDNGTYDAWGTVALVSPFGNTYTGVTAVNKGRLVITRSDMLGDTSAGTTIGSMGTLALYGAGQTVNEPIVLTEPVTITRDTYTGGDFGLYEAAIQNNDVSNTISGPFVVDSVDGRVAAYGNTTLTITSNITQGPNVVAGVLSVTGSYGGTVVLAGDNTGLTGGVKVGNRATVSVSSEANLGGPTAPLTFAGDGYLRINGGFLTNFGSHPVNTDTFYGGIDTPDAGQTFTVDVPLGSATTAVGAINKRGLGTLNLNATVNLRGSQTWWDAGTVNVNAPVTLNSLHLRSPQVNIGTGGSVTVVGGPGGWNSIGADSNGTAGGPDKAVINITGNGQLIQTSGDDFNVSDNADTEGTINIYDSGVLTTGGITFLGKRNGAVATVNQYGGTININRGGNFGFVLGDGRRVNGVPQSPTGIYNLSGGTFNSNGEVYVGEGGDAAAGGVRAHGYWTQTGGTANVNQWFVVGRENAVGFVDISGGTLNHNTTGNMVLGDSNAGGEVNTIKVRGTAVINNNTGGLWVGNNGSAVAVMDVYDTASIKSVGNVVVGRDGGTGTVTFKDNSSLTVVSGELWVGQNAGKGTLNIEGNASVTVQNNWLALGRANGSSVGTLNLSGSATLTKAGGGNIAVGSGGTGTFNQTGGTLISNGTRVGEASNGTMDLTGGTATFTGGFSIGHNNNVVGTLNVGGTANVTVPNVVFGAEGTGTGGGSLNLSGNATLTGASFTGGATSTGAKTFKFDGGTLVASADTTNFIGAKITSVVSTGGAKIDTNGKNVTVNSALTHDATLADDDGGLVKGGAGTLRLAGANTYTGGTTVSAGTLHANTPGSLPGYATPGKVMMASGTTLAVSAGGTDEWSSADIATMRSTVAFPAGSALGIDTTNAAAPVAYDQVLPGPVGLTKLGGGSLVLSGANTYEGPTTVNAGGTLVLTSAAWGPVLTGPGGAVVDSRLAFDYVGTTTPASTILPYLESSYATSNFTDPSQRIRTSNANVPHHGLGYFDDVVTSQLAVAYTWYGDANLDGVVDADDFVLVDRGDAMGLGGWMNGDFNYDGTVTADDYALIDTSFGLQPGGAGLSPEFLAMRQAQFGDAYVSRLIAAVPEPGSLGLAALGAVSVLGRRRRNS